MAKMLRYDDREWTNWHLTVKDVPIAARYELLNSPEAPSLERMAESAAEVQQLIAAAFADRRRLRAQGSAWSFSEAPSVPGGWSLSTGYANWLFDLPASHVHSAYPDPKEGLVLCQTGVSVAELNMYLEPRGRSLATSGASNGQTFVGAMSTGTHGSAIEQAAIQGQVVGLQLIPDPHRNLWIEPASRPVTDGRMAGAIGATMIRDDLLFAAALVSLGALGVIHSVLIRTVPRFLLQTHRDRIPLTSGLEKAMTELVFDDADLPGPDEKPYFFQSVVNQHIDPGFAYVTAGYFRDWEAGHRLRYDVENKRGPGYNLGVIVANLLQAAPNLTLPITKAVLQDQLSRLSGDRKKSWGQSFNFTTPRAGTAGSSTAVSAEHVMEVLDILQRALAAKGPAPLAFACRYAIKSPGLLAFVRYPRTAIIDIDGIDTRATRAVMSEAVAGLRSAGIPHAEHWGKLNQLTAQSVRDSYREDLDTWMRVRTDLLGRDGEYVFGNAFLDRIALTNPSF